MYCLLGIAISAVILTVDVVNGSAFNLSPCYLLLGFLCWQQWGGKRPLLFAIVGAITLGLWLSPGGAWPAAERLVAIALIGAMAARKPGRREELFETRDFVPRAAAESGGEAATATDEPDRNSHQVSLLAGGAVRVDEAHPTTFGDYLVVGLLGKGGAGLVFRARHAPTGQTVALKILAKPQQTKRFEREMHVVQKLAHPHVVVAYDVGYVDDSLFISMELIEGPNLAKRVADSGPLAPEEALRHVLQTAMALEHAHSRGLIHRDVKPGNLLVTAEGRVKLADLGLARLVTDNSDEDEAFETLFGAVGGTIEFMAPEQAMSLSDADERSDIYSLGCTLFFLLTGSPLLRGKTFIDKFRNLTIKRIFHDVAKAGLPKKQTDVLRKMVAYEPQFRFQSVSEAIAELRASMDEAVEEVVVRVLVVEDSEIDLMATLRLLAKSNKAIQTTTVSTLGQAKHACAEQVFDLILLDLNLPDSSGPSTVAELHGANPHDALIVVLTGHADEDTVRQCRQAGAAELLSKDELTVAAIERKIFVTLTQGTGNP